MAIQEGTKALTFGRIGEIRRRLRFIKIYGAKLYEASKRRKDDVLIWKHVENFSNVRENEFVEYANARGWLAAEFITQFMPVQDTHFLFDKDAIARSDNNRYYRIEPRSRKSGHYWKRIDPKNYCVSTAIPILNLRNNKDVGKTFSNHETATIF